MVKDKNTTHDLRTKLVVPKSLCFRLDRYFDTYPYCLYDLKITLSVVSLLLSYLYLMSFIFYPLSPNRINYPTCHYMIESDFNMFV